MNGREIGTQIRRARCSKGMTQAELAKAIGVTHTTINRLESGTQNIALFKLLKIAEILQVPSYSFFSKEPLTTKADVEKDPVIVEHFPDKTTHEAFNRMRSRDDFYPIRIYGTASLGQGRIIETEEIKGFALIYKDALPKGSAPKKFSETPRIVCLYAEGDSMSPTIQDRSLVAIDLEDRDEIKKNKIYAVEIPDSGVTLKRVFKVKEHLMLFADNPNEPGFPNCIYLSEVRYNPVCGRVVWAWNKF